MSEHCVPCKDAGRGWLLLTDDEQADAVTGLFSQLPIAVQVQLLEKALPSLGESMPAESKASAAQAGANG